MSMINHSKSIQSKKTKDFEDFISKKMYPRKKLQEKQLVVNSFSRASDWSKERTFEQDAIRVLTEGVVPLYHPDLYNFRKTERANKTDIYVRNYVPASQRAEAVHQAHQKVYLEHTPYMPLDRPLEKSRALERELGPTMRYGLRTEKERLKTYLNGPNRLIDASPLANTKMLVNPEWKSNDKRKWVVGKNFDTATNSYKGTGRFTTEPWDTTQGGLNIGDNYIDGHEVVGDLSRKRNKRLELSKDFLTTVSPNNKAAGFLPPLDSNSLRSGIAAKYLEVFADRKGRFYPKTLRHLQAQSPDFLSSPKASSPSPISPEAFNEERIIQVKAGPIESLKESLASLLNTKTGAFLHGEKSMRKTGLGNTKRLKDSGLDKSDYIKQAVKTYFD